MQDSVFEMFPWSDTFSLGIPSIDTQHRKLVSLLNDVANCIILRKSSPELESSIANLLDYAVFHFETEDQYWGSELDNSFEAQEHRAAHNAFITQVNYIKSNVSDQQTDLWLEELLSFLASWLVSHILESDKHMSLLVFATQQGKDPVQALAWADAEIRNSAKSTINAVMNAYKRLSKNTMLLMREVQSGQISLRKLYKSEQRLEEAMDYAKIGRWSFAYNGKVAQWSPQMYTLFGLNQDSTPGPETLCGIMQNGFQDAFIQSMRKTFETGEEHHIEYQIKRPNDGALRWIECRGKLINYEDGSPKKISGFVQDITDRKDNEFKFTQLAFYDPLTSLPNRRLLIDRLNQSLAQSERNRYYYALLFIDIDDFKTINDSHGHDYGDAFLQQAAQRIQHCLRKGDTLARIGGDEFVVAISQLDESKIEAKSSTDVVIQKILRALAVPFVVNKAEFNSSASIGAHLFNDGSASVTELMRKADIAMYESKRDGKNVASFYTEAMQNQIQERVELDRKLRKAIADKEFELFYQPQLNHKSEIVGAEGLIRWIDGEHIRYPDSFIPFAEENGLILELGQRVVNAACEQLALWANCESTSHLTISVNVSYKQFRQANFVSSVKEIIRKTGVKPNHLKLELTETMLIDNIESTIKSMKALQEFGVRLALDDFGTGYSSLQYLKLLPLCQLKIDKSFVTDLETDASDRSIVKTIILMAKTLGLDVIAEGVETQYQRDYLERHDCNFYQGFLFSKALPLNDFESLLLVKSEL